MNIADVQVYKGRNIFSHRPVIKAAVDIGNYFNTPTKDIAGFNESLLEQFPGLTNHCCSRGYEGGFAERLLEGTYLAHVTEHLILELQSRAGYDVRYGKSILYEQPSIYHIIFEFINEKCAVECLIYAVKIINLLLSGELPDALEIIRHLQKVAAQTDPGPSTQALLEEARHRNIPVNCIGYGSLLQMGYGKYTRYAEASLSDKPSCVAVDIAGNKQLTRQILSNNDIPVPYGDIACTEEAALLTASLIGFPVVLKPFDANQGKGVALDLNSFQEVSAAFEEAMKFSSAVVIEKFIKGRDYRVLVVGDRVSAAAERIPPYVQGDGVHSIIELVDMENMNPLRGEDHEKPLTKIKLDYQSMQLLLKGGKDKNYILHKGEIVYIKQNGNISTGGTARDCTDEIHPYNRILAIKAAGLLGLDIAGIDITAEDITKPLSSENGAVIEVNAAPGLRMHLHPAEGKPRNVAKDIVEMLFPNGRPCSIPLVSITGTNGKTTVTRLVSHILSLTGRVVGMTNTEGTFIDGRCVLKGDNTGPAGAAMVLADKKTEAAVLETARGGIIKKGLGYDLADVGVIVNISDDHLGMDGVETIEDLAHVKALVVEAVKDEGYAVLNADDKTTPYMMERIKSRLILFGMDFANPIIQKHLENGGKSIIAKDNAIFACAGKDEMLIAEIDEIPITMKGNAVCNVENSLAAVAALTCLNVNAGHIRKGLESFRPDIETNPGRFNIFDIDGISVMLDYGHNAAGYRAVIDFIHKTVKGRSVGIIGMPGDRMDQNIEEVGRLCGSAFTKLYIKEDVNLRNRDPGEVADMLFGAAISAGMKKEDITVVFSEVKALEAAIMDAERGDFIVMFYEEFEPAVQTIIKQVKQVKQGTVLCSMIRFHVS